MKNTQGSKCAAARVIVFSDLDGTLLDHETYSYAPAIPTLGRLTRHDIPLILASSKTAAEMVPLRQELGFAYCPMICENGAGVVGAHHDSKNTCAYERLRAVLAELPPDLRQDFNGFGDMTPDHIAGLTGLSPNSARRASQREFSEPGLWTGTEEARARFLSLLSVHGVTGRQGGRFLTLNFGANKAEHMAQIAQGFERDIVIALGDAPNDAEMLEAADHAIVLPNRQGAPMPALRGVKAQQAARAGPEGWHASLGDLLSRLGVPD